MDYLQVKSPLDEDDKNRFNLIDLNGRESICDDFAFSLTVNTAKQLIPDEFNALLGKSLTLSIGYEDDNGNDQFRLINGVIYHLEQIDFIPSIPDGALWAYRIEIGSWLRQLKHAQDNRIYQAADNTYLKIVHNLLTELGFDHDSYFRIATGKTYSTRKFVTQYQETYFDFILRLLAQEGLIFRFEHFENSHIMVIEHDSTLLSDLNKPTQNGIIKRINPIGSFQGTKEIQSASYHWQTPSVKNIDFVINESEPGLRTYAYPWSFSDRSSGEKKAELTANFLNREIMIYEGESSITSLEPGYMFQIDQPDFIDLHEQKFLIVRIDTDATSGAFENYFTFVPADQPYIMHPHIKKPLISGSQTAIVVGAETPSNVSSEKHGRVKVRFHWDHNSPSDDTWCAGYVRVAMPGAGKDRGFVFTPQVGEEVVVTFEDGDPDKPIIIGSVYTGNMNLPSHPGEKPTKSIIKTHANKESNQVSFDDKDGKELLYMNAKKDFEFHVLNDSKVSIRNNAERKVEGEQKISISKNETLEIKGDQKTSIEENYTFNVDKDAKQIIGQNSSYDIGDVLKVNAKGDIIIKGASISFESTKGDISIQSAKNIMTDAGENIQSKSAKAVNLEAGTDLVSKAGKIAQIEGGSSIMIKSTKIDIKGSSTVTIKGGKTTVN